MDEPSLRIRGAQQRKNSWIKFNLGNCNLLQTILGRYCGLSVELCAVIMKHKHSSNAGITKATKFIGKTYTVQDIKSSAVRSSVSSSSFEVGTGPSDENQITCL